MFKNVTCLMLTVLLGLITSDAVCADFMRGMDISIQTRQEADGVTYREDGVAKDVLTIFQNHDVNWIRIRLFHTPSGSEYGVCQNLAYVTTLGARVKAAGFKFLLDIHYSDTWADPTHQTIPSAWSSYSHSQLVTAVHDYTQDVIEHLRTNSAMPDMVQIGNEIPCGMLWPDGEVCYNGNWSNLADLINAGISGIEDGRGTETMPEIMIHIDRGGDASTTEWFFDNLIANGVVFDVIGQSFYPEWHGTLSDLANCLNFMANNYSQDIIVVETAEYYTGSSGKSEENQKAFLEDLIQTVQATPNGKGRGVCYWEPTWVWSSGVGYKVLFAPINNNWQNVNMLAGLSAFDDDSDVTPPSAPAGLSATADIASIFLDWIDNSESDLAGYNVYRSTASGGSYTQLNTLLITDSSYTDSSVSVGTTYYYVVTAVDTSSNESVYSVEVSAAPSGSVAVYTFTGITAADTDNNAYACDVDIFPFAGDSANRNTQVEATDLQYTYIASDDSTEWTTADPGSYDEILLWVEMKVNESPANIGRIDLTFDGYTSSSSTVTHRIYVLTADADWTQTASWTQIGTDQSITGGTYASITRSITSNISNYIDSNGIITWAVYETTSSEAMHVNYLEMAITHVSVNVPPAVSVTLPSDGEVFSQNAAVTINADASDSDGNVTLVEFYQGSTKLGEDTTAPYSYTWTSVPTGNYSLTAAATDNDGGSTASSPVDITVLGSQGTGAILYERWTGITGTAVSDLTSSANYPDSPDSEELLVSLEGYENWGDNYGARFRGYLNPAVSGDYTFQITSDADSQLWLSTDEYPANASLIAYVSGSPQSSSISLVAGQKYYIEVLHKEGTGDDSVSVSWQGPGIAQQVIDGVFLSPCCLDFVNYADFAGQWNRDDCTAANAWCGGADRNRDGEVLIDDLFAFTDAWLLGIE